MNPSIPSGIVVAHPVRLKPGDDIVSSMETQAALAMKKSATTSSFILAAVGSLDNLVLRMANSCNENGVYSNELREWKERLEVVSLSGTFSKDGKHLHMSVSDENGNVYGGHLVSGKVFTTLELVIGVILNVDFSRVHDARTGYKELVIKSIE